MYEFDFELDDFQKEAIDYIKDGKSVVVCAPTGAGKTCIAQSAIHLALENGSRIFYTTPLKALSNQKFSDFSEKYGADKVGLLTGDTTINRGAQIVVMTTEVFRNMLYGTTFGTLADNLKDVKYVVLDEVHYMNDEERGTVWEESIIYCPSDIQIIALSATVANSRELTSWINTVHSKTEHVWTDFRPVPLRFFYYDSSKPREILPMFTPEGALNKKIRPESKFKHFKNPKGARNPVVDIVSALEHKKMLPAIYFTFSRKKCDENAKKCSGLDLLTKEERLKVNEIIDDYLIDNPYLENNPQIDLLKCGVASHHAGLLPGFKVLVEKLFQSHLIKVVFATETLAAGINMPAKTTVISSVSKRGDNGHRMLTANEFLQMSGRAGRRGMDDIGYVVVVGTPFQTPDEVATLVRSKSNPLESKFTPTYSMVLNLLQRFSIEEARELIFKTFGYYSSTSRIEPFIRESEEIKRRLDYAENYPCDFSHTSSDLMEFIKFKNMYVEYRTIFKTLKRQAKQGSKGLPKEAYEIANKATEYRKQMEKFGCNNCKRYSKHRKEIEVIQRSVKKLAYLQKEIEFQKDIYWNVFLSHKKVLEKFGHIKDDYPTEIGKTTMGLRCENELYLSEIIQSGILDKLDVVTLASVVCALSSEEKHLEDVRTMPPSKACRKVLNEIKEIKRKIFLSERDEKIENTMNLYAHFCYFIETWVSANLNKDNNTTETWEALFADSSFSQGDVVRAFKRTIDVLRQFTTVENVNPELAEVAACAIKLINKEPVNID
ncbi:DEAD/DEAH box helicase [bacterium]|nr:DEAD/DEAH box helicase [bacterium]